jgi:probable rRNA maturation factor
VLHLAGFDHEADAGEMAAREAELRRELRVETSLIARVSGPVAKGTKKQKRNTEILPLRQAQGQNDGHRKRVRA